MSAFQGPVYVALRASTSLTLALITTHIAIGVAVAVAYPFSLPQCALIGAITINGGVSIWKNACKRFDDVIAVLLTSSDGWQVNLRGGAVFNAHLASDPFMTRYFTVLPFKLESGIVKRVLMLNDNMDVDAHRRLRVHLRLSKDARTPGNP